VLDVTGQWLGKKGDLWARWQGHVQGLGMGWKGDGMEESEGKKRRVEWEGQRKGMDGAGGLP